MTDCFAVLGLPRTFDLNMDDLRRRARRMRADVHPDASGSGRGHADIVDAARTLTDPVARASHLLNLQGIARGSDEHTETDPAILIAELERREALFEATSTGEVETHVTRGQQSLGDAGAVFSQAYIRHDWTAAQKALVSLMYAHKFLKDAQARLKTLSS